MSADMFDRLSSWRDRLLSRPAVRDRLGRLPVGRRIAARHAERLFGVLAGVAHHQMLVAALELGLFDRLAGGAVRKELLFDGLDLPPFGAESLLRALVALDFVEARGDRLALTIDGLVIASDEGIRAMAAHHRLLYADLADPVGLLRTPGLGCVGAFWPYRGAGDPAGYSALMAASQSFVAPALASAYDFGRHRALLDLGGGDGSWARAAARRWPHLRVALAELPEAAALARERLAGTTVAVHEREDEAGPLPGGFDVISLVRVLHDRDDSAAVALLCAARGALAPGGRLVIAEPMARPGRDPQAAYFAAYFAAMGQGKLRSPAEIAELARAAEWRPARPRHPGPLLTVLTCTSVPNA